ncbi:uncharacterized protein EV422DRAFT_605658 [Fimicolochytrium jonesii]|uniref:uncharacterized protein n=1 Tax=Fimicolochytrium jonesii TaxID=1396493 RepID=UPI0022FDB6B6|nr:uncharacterized protein EV422DRAFT_605658 [Fimicolochytrium jonesii]KAI8825068.1 hypothetical protein EV422DRAFT_605658 [Fimicolochytrium jonesii]
MVWELCVLMLFGRRGCRDLSVSERVPVMIQDLAELLYWSTTVRDWVWVPRGLPSYCTIQNERNMYKAVSGAFGGATSLGSNVLQRQFRAETSRLFPLFRMDLQQARSVARSLARLVAGGQHHNNITRSLSLPHASHKAGFKLTPGTAGFRFYFASMTFLKIPFAKMIEGLQSSLNLRHAPGRETAATHSNPSPNALGPSEYRPPPPAKSWPSNAWKTVFRVAPNFCCRFLSIGSVAFWPRDMVYMFNAQRPTPANFTKNTLSGQPLQDPTELLSAEVPSSPTPSLTSTAAVAPQHGLNATARSKMWAPSHKFARRILLLSPSLPPTQKLGRPGEPGTEAILSAMSIRTESCTPPAEELGREHARKRVRKSPKRGLSLVAAWSVSLPFRDESIQPWPPRSTYSQTTNQGYHTRWRLGQWTRGQLYEAYLELDDVAPDQFMFHVCVLTREENDCDELLAHRVNPDDIVREDDFCPVEDDRDDDEDDRDDDDAWEDHSKSTTFVKYVLVAWPRFHDILYRDEAVDAIRRVLRHAGAELGQRSGLPICQVLYEKAIELIDVDWILFAMDIHHIDVNTWEVETLIACVRAHFPWAGLANEKLLVQALRRHFGRPWIASDSSRNSLLSDSRVARLFRHTSPCQGKIHLYLPEERRLPSYLVSRIVLVRTALYLVSARGGATGAVVAALASLSHASPQHRSDAAPCNSSRWALPDSLTRSPTQVSPNTKNLKRSCAARCLRNPSMASAAHQGCHRRPYRLNAPDECERCDAQCTRRNHQVAQELSPLGHVDDA